ncbi:plastocyanin/azurin family copper-binding protein [Halococcus thailandensis]|uniref:Halocyanin hcpC n=1 Tax=Halococcus thailandensis JCM 13552 TaxID=1227457 RepID=M0N0R1_9EURY|nr:plastocyanin/azurin family copper-binding protein [Halococcus thailandensis]EMA51138.1 halocyanin hcpC [Halococcus thailandensis JCM 13552]
MQRTNRRRFLAGIATTGTVLAAGCSSSGSAGDGGDDSNGTSGGSGGGNGSGGNATSESGGSTSGDATAGGNGTGGASGNSSAGGETTTVASGPDGRLVFEPEAVEVSVGDTVSWEFESAGHNVGAVPKDSEEVSLPDGAEPFASYDGDPYAVVEEGQTYEHTFETAGEYTYVCIPHVSSGMVGTVTVSE